MASADGITAILVSSHTGPMHRLRTRVASDEVFPLGLICKFFICY